MQREALVAELEQARPVDARAIEAELSHIWKQTTQPLADWHDEEQPIVRSCVANLVVVAADEAMAAQASSVVQVLLERHPTRAVVLRMIPESSERAVEAVVRAHCHLPGWSRSYVCCEEVALVVRGRDEVRHVRGNLLPLLIADLPTVLWWPGSPFEHPLVGRLAELCEHFIIDSTQFASLTSGFEGLLSISNRASLHLDCRDLSWARLTPWRSLVAQFFDSAQARPFLDLIDYVTIAYCQDDHEAAPNLAEALLLAGWLAARQGWQPAEQLIERRGERLLLHMHSAARPITLDLRPNDEYAIAPGALASVRLQARSTSPRAEFSVARLDDPNFVLTLAHAGSRQPVPRVARLNQSDVAHLISAELDLPGRDSTFIAALQAAIPLAAALA